MIRRYEQDGKVWEVTSIIYTRYAGQPCQQFDMRGDPDGYFPDYTEIIEVRDLGDDWTRYWVTSTDPVLRDATRCLVESHEYGRSRGWE